MLVAHESLLCYDDLSEVLSRTEVFHAQPVLSVILLR